MPNRTLEPMMKPSGFQAQEPILSPSSVSTTSASKTMKHADHGQQDAQHQREVARAHAGAVADGVVGGAPGEGDAHAVNISPATKSFWLLILMSVSSMDSEGRIVGVKGRQAMWVSPT
jgi:hypothetical protein